MFRTLFFFPRTTYQSFDEGCIFLETRIQFGKKGFIWTIIYNKIKILLSLTHYGLMMPLGHHFNEILFESQIFHSKENSFEMDVCKMLAVSFEPPRLPTWNVTSLTTANILCKRKLSALTLYVLNGLNLWQTYINLHFVSFLAQVDEIHHQNRKGTAYITWLYHGCWYLGDIRSQGISSQWYWPSSHGLFCSLALPKHEGATLLTLCL